MTIANLWALHFLWLIPLIIVVFIIHFRQRKKALERFAEPDLLARLSGRYQRWKRVLKVICMLSAFGLMIIALAGPRWGSHYQEVSRKGVDIIIVADVSRSMLAEDVKASRLERARREILDFLDVIEGDRVGLVAFSGMAFVQCPLTFDYGALKMFLSSLNPDLIPVPGTDLGSAIETGFSSFDVKSETDRVMLLITDGEDNENRGFKAAEKAVDMGVKIFIFGIGDPSGGPIPDDDRGGFKKDKEGKLILSRLNESGLKKIATVTGGAYIKSIGGDLDLDRLYFEGIKSRTEAATLKSGKIKVYEERFQIFLLAAFLFLILESLINERRWET